MALAKATLKQGLKELFQNPNADPLVLAGQWAGVMQTYASGLTPVSTAAATAAAALKVSLAKLFVKPDPPQVAGMDTAFMAFAAALAVGQLPLNTGIPPTALPGFALPSPLVESHEDAAETFATRIHAWMLKGKTALVAPPNSPGKWL